MNKHSAGECSPQGSASAKPDPARIGRLEAAVRDLIDELTKSKSLAVHAAVQQAWFMQKAEELRLLHRQLADAEEKLNAVRRRAAIHYQETFLQWRRDIRWLRQHQRNVSGS